MIKGKLSDMSDRMICNVYRMELTELSWSAYNLSQSRIEKN